MATGSEKPSSDRASVMRQVGAMAGVGIEFLIAVLLPCALGFWLDSKLGSRPWVMILGTIVGFAIGLYRLLKTAAGVMR